MCFTNKMLELQKTLELVGHKILIPINTHACLKNSKLNESLEHCENFADIEIDKDHFNKIAESDAILVLNFFKNNMHGYIGGATLMEIGIARYLDKKIFILHKLPGEDVLRYVLEIKLTKPIILNGDLTKIK